MAAVATTDSITHVGIHRICFSRLVNMSTQYMTPDAMAQAEAANMMAGWWVDGVSVQSSQSHTAIHTAITTLKKKLRYIVLNFK